MQLNATLHIHICLTGPMMSLNMLKSLINRKGFCLGEKKKNYFTAANLIKANQKKKVYQTSGALFLTRPLAQPLNFPSMWQKQCCQLTLPQLLTVLKPKYFAKPKPVKRANFLTYQVSFWGRYGNRWVMENSRNLATFSGNCKE